MQRYLPLSDHLFLFSLLCHLNSSDFDSHVEHFFDQVGLWDHILFSWCNFWHIEWFRRLYVQEWYENTDLKHVHKLLVESLSDHIEVSQLLIVKNLELVLLNQK